MTPGNDPRPQWLIDIIYPPSQVDEPPQQDVELFSSEHECVAKIVLPLDEATRQVLLPDIIEYHGIYYKCVTLDDHFQRSIGNVMYTQALIYHVQKEKG